VCGSNPAEGSNPSATAVSRHDARHSLRRGCRASLLLSQLACAWSGEPRVVRISALEIVRGELHRLLASGSVSSVRYRDCAPGQRPDAIRDPGRRPRGVDSEPPFGIGQAITNFAAHGSRAPQIEPLGHRLRAWTVAGLCRAANSSANTRTAWRHRERARRAS
jgi:hypothetical protein